MRRRALLVALLAGGLVASAGVALGSGALEGHGTPTTPAAIARAELNDAAAPAAFSRARDHEGREHHAAHDVLVGLAIALALVSAGGWWLLRARARRDRGAVPVASWRTRAPPGLPVIVHC
jgi:hypothetical protein